MNIYLIIYVIVALGLCAGGSYKLNQLEQPLATVIYFLGSLFFLVVYGLRWFGDDSSIFANTPAEWPPVINTCPDYLTYYKRAKSNGTFQDTCIDLIGVSTNGTLKVFPKNSNAPTDDNFYFDATGINNFKENRNVLCQRAMSAGLTWEGITNGDSCVNPDGSVAPAPPPASKCP
jgi:hypothetical protein